MNKHSVTSAYEPMVVDNNGSWSDAYQFDDPDDLTWTLNGCSFEMDVQLNAYDKTPLLSLTTANGRIITDDVVQRVIHFNVTAADIQANLDPGNYFYDLVMIDSYGVRWPFMHGTVKIVQGITYP
jgi:hypothetical protein